MSTSLKQKPDEQLIAQLSNVKALSQQHLLKAHSFFHSTWLSVCPWPPLCQPVYSKMVAQPCPGSSTTQGSIADTNKRQGIRPHLCLFALSLWAISVYTPRLARKRPRHQCGSTHRDCDYNFLFRSQIQRKRNCVMPKLCYSQILALMYPISNRQYNMYNIIWIYFDNRDGSAREVKGNFKRLGNGVLFHLLRLSNCQYKTLKETLTSCLMKVYNLASKVYKYIEFFLQKKSWLGRIQNVNIKGHKPQMLAQLRQGHISEKNAALIFPGCILYTIYPQFPEILSLHLINK